LDIDHVSCTLIARYSDFSHRKAATVSSATGLAKTNPKAVFDVQRFLDSAGVARRVVEFKAKATIFAQGDPAKSVMYIQKGRVKISVVNPTGKEAVAAVLGQGHFLGEKCLTGQSTRIGTAAAMLPSTLLVIEKDEMIRLLHKEHELSDRFISFLLTRNIRVEADLVDQLFNSTEKRLARTLLLLAQYGNQNQPQKVVPKMSQEVLAEMVGTTRSRVNFFMNKFKRLGFIGYDSELHINTSLLSVVLHD